ncbi:hypothetical protein ACFYPC_02995 [Streptomyces sp. NPDC005808]|uniref:hypothetical protein n=1 Tax=Streptomyces sp. NPDC005808 TaxID=3364734 RepID=UPI0036BF7568
MNVGAPRRILVIAAVAGLLVFTTGIAVSVATKGMVWTIVSVTLQSLGSAVLFPILVSFAYDKLRERWLGDEVWRLFNELSDAGITRVYKDREFNTNADNAQTRLSEEFLSHQSGEIYIMGPTLRVFFNPLGPFYRDIERMLRNANGAVRMQALIEHSDSPAVRERTSIEEPNLAPGQKPQTERDADSTIATVLNVCATTGSYITLRRFMPAPYCTVVIFPNVAFFSPNILAPEAPVRLPMILFRSGSHGYRMLKASFNYLWDHAETIQAVP